MEMTVQRFFNNHMRGLIRSNTNYTELVSMPFQKEAQLNSNLEHLPKEIRDVFGKLFNASKSKIELNAILPFKLRMSSAPFCHKMLNKKNQSYRCFDCQIHPESLLCENCFKNGNHIGHRYQQVKDEGNCDCGSRNLIKQQGFCSTHKGDEEIIEINSSEEFIFNLYIRQLFIWILKLFKSPHVKQGENLLYHFVTYLTSLNDTSLYYNKLTTNILFSEINPMSDHLFYLSIGSSDRGKMVKAVTNLFFKMLMLGEFKVKLLTSLMRNYNKILQFESSKYVKLFYPLLNEPEVVLSAMEKHPIPLRPERQFIITLYYHHLSIIKDIKPESAKAFLKPLLMVDTIRFPFLKNIEQNCQLRNNLIVTVFPEFQKEQYTYYTLLMNIIKVINEKEVLEAMIKNYYLLIREFSFRKNKIILVPQRIFVLLIFKYFDYDLKQIDGDEIARILEISKEKLNGFISRMCLKFAQCLFEFSMNLNRTNYFQNYLNIYVKEIGQIICIDYLGIKILAILLHESNGFQSILEHIYRADNERMNYSPQQRADFFMAGNIFLKVLLQIIYSPRTELIISSFLGRQNVLLTPILKQLFQNTSEITSKQLQTISQVFNYKQISRQVIDNTLVFDVNKKKYVPKANEEENIDVLNLQFMISLLQTKFSKFVQKKSETEKYLQLSVEQEDLKDIILSCDILQSIISKQLKLIDDLKDHKHFVRQLIKLVKMLKLAYKKQQSKFNSIQSIIIQAIHQKYSVGEQTSIQDRKFLQEVEDTFNNQKELSNIQQSSEKQALRRKELLRAKKDKMIKNKKIKQNQEMFLSTQVEKEQNNLEMCLICRQNNNHEEMCYVAQMKYTGFLLNFMESKQDNVIFKSCFHTVHFDCFMKLDKPKESTNCPLCKCVINILLPLENAQKYSLFQKINHRISLVFSYFLMMIQSEQNKCFISQTICFLAYVFIANFENLTQIKQKQQKLLKILYKLVDHNMSFQDRSLKAKSDNEEFLQKLNTNQNQNKCCYQALFQLIFIFLRRNYSKIEDIEHSQKILKKLNTYIEAKKTSKIISILSDVVSLPEKSILQPILTLSLQMEEFGLIEDRIKFINLLTPPSDVESLLKLRDHHALLCKTGHQICICVICHQASCLTCKKTSIHIKECHARQCLLFNTYTGGLFYFYKGLELAIRCLYTNDLEKVWKPSEKVDNFLLDSKLYEQILSEFKAGNLYTFLINTFEGLKGGNLSDRL